MEATLDSSVVLGIDIGGTNVRLALVDRRGNMESRKAIPVASLGENDPLIQLVNVVTEFIEQNLGNRALLAVGVGVPGIIDQNGKIISCPNLGFLENSDLQMLLNKELGAPIFIEKDVNFILYGEFHNLQLQDVRSLVGFYIGTGFGCGLLINGDIYRGAHGFAGELGHIPLKGHLGACNCGNKGCLELYGAGRSLVERSAAHGVTVADFFTNPATAEEVVEFLDYVRVGILSAINILDPEFVIIGGGVVQMTGFPWRKLERQIRNGLRSNLIKEQLQIVPSKAEIFGGCLGAAFYCFDRVGN